jgi:hypothetical protein
MVTRPLVESEIEQGARLLRALDEAGIPIDVSYWFLSPEWGDWWLVLATPLVDGSESRTSRFRIIDVLRSLDDVDYLMDKVGMVGMDHRWVRALRKTLGSNLQKPGYRLGPFYAEDMEVLDSYVYRLSPPSQAHGNGKTSEHRASRNGSASSRKARTGSPA